MIYLLWIPSLIIIYALSAWLSYKNNVADSKAYFYVMWALGLRIFMSCGH
jgi:hypothetical protein